MSCKLSNSVRLNHDSQQWAKASSLDSSVKLAGEEAKDRLYEPKHKKKAVRVLTVIAYVFFVSLAAIMLSLYYVFLWNGNSKDAKLKRTIISAKICNDEIMQRMVGPAQSFEFTTALPADTTSELDTEDLETPREFVRRSLFVKKLLYKKHVNDMMKDLNPDEQRFT